MLRGVLTLEQWEEVQVKGPQRGPHDGPAS